MQPQIDARSQILPFFSYLQNETEIESGQRAIVTITNMRIAYEDGAAAPTLFLDEAAVLVKDTVGTSNGMLTYGGVRAEFDIPEGIVQRASEQEEKVSFLLPHVVIDTTGPKVTISDDPADVQAVIDKSTEEDTFLA